MRGIPRLFLTANSGARIGMAQSLKNKFKVAFVDEADPSKGFKYIYMDEGGQCLVFTSSVLELLAACFAHNDHLCR